MYPVPTAQYIGVRYIGVCYEVSANANLRHWREPALFLASRVISPHVGGGKGVQFEFDISDPDTFERFIGLLMEKEKREREGVEVG